MAYTYDPLPNTRTQNLLFLTNSLKLVQKKNPYKLDNEMNSSVIIITC